MKLAAMRRLQRRANVQRVPRPVDGQVGLFVVDATWGRIAPIELAPGVRTVGELELIEHCERGLPLVDTRPADAFGRETIPGSLNLSWHDAEALVEQAPEDPAIYFCNGPQCSATPAAIQSLLEAGRAPASILYYRGGLHDWITLGLPVEPGR